MNEQKSSMFYGWWVVLAAFVSVFIGVGVGVFTFGVFFKDLIQEFGWNRATLSIASTIYVLIGAVVGPFMGTLNDKYGSRLVMTLGTCIMAASLIGLSWMKDLWYLYVMYGLMGIGFCGLYISAMAVVSNWFIRKRGTALGLMFMGIGAGGLVLAPLTNYFILSFGWRTAYILLGVITLLLAVPTINVFIKTKPEDVGLLPDGAMAGPGKGGPMKIEGLSAQEAMRTPTFWILAAVFFLFSCGLTGVTIHLVPYLRDVGFSPTTAASIFGIVSGLSILGRLGFGYLADRIDVRYVTVMSYALCIIGLLFLMGVGPSAMIFVVGFVATYSFSYGGDAALQPIIAAKCFGRAAIGKILGYLYVPFSVGLGLWPFLGGYIFDVRNSYDLAFSIYIAAFFLSCIAILFIKTGAWESRKP
ncbi:MAG TPA: MFS transporter [Thermodesulfobacteriota bacterium]|nr:MFS transporter [Thermodesulfobacteriota bacterium]HNU72494.1 MFS transporter [Thermodesulfobacteriota bacterium]